MCFLVYLCMLFYCVCITLVAGCWLEVSIRKVLRQAHLGTGFSWFPCVYKRMLRWFPTLQVATACFSCSPPDLNFLDPYFIFMYAHYNHCHRATAHLQLNILLLLLFSTVLFLFCSFSVSFCLSVLFCVFSLCLFADFVICTCTVKCAR